MKFLPLIWRNLTRKKTRTVFTLLSVLCTFFLFGFLMAVRQGFATGAKLPGQGMLITLLKEQGAGNNIPENYTARIAAVDGVKAVLPIAVHAFYYREKKNMAGVGAVDPDTLFRVLPKLKVPRKQREKWTHDRIGAIVRDTFAKRHGWKVGDHVPLLSATHPGKTLEINIDGIQDTSGNFNIGFGSLFVHFDYMRTWTGNDGLGAFIERAANPAQTSAVAKRINAALANSSVPTRTQPVQAVVQNQIARFGDIGAITIAVAIAALIGMLIVTANTMAQSIRERVAELAAMRALGFSRASLVWLVLGESLFLTALGGLVGLGLAWLATVLMGPAFAKVVPGLYFSPMVIAIGVGLIVLLSLVAALAPSVRAVRLQVATALGSR
jgi:putative ABC transport system permease protein